MAEKKEKPANQSKSFTDSDTSDDAEVNPRFKTSVEERQYNTIQDQLQQPTLHSVTPGCKLIQL